MQSHERQSVARDQHVAQRRGAGGGESDEEERQQHSSYGAQANLPKVDLAQLVASHNTMEANGTVGDTSKVLKDILGVVINMYAKGEDIDNVKKVAEDNSYRISQLEAKIGKPEEVSLQLGLAVRHLPLPGQGLTELDNVRMAFKEINAAGVEVRRDVIKAVRVGYKAESEPGSNNGNLGTVKVEMKNEESRAAVMKTKNNLRNHPQLVMRKLVIQNLKSREEMKNENFNYDILKMVSNGNDFYIGGNGHIRKRDQANFNNAQQSFTVPPPAFNQQPIRAPYTQAHAVYRQGPAPTLYGQAHSSRYQQPHHHIPRPPHHPPPPGQYHGQQQASLLDIDNIFNFDPTPIPTDNPYKAPVNAIPPPPPQDQHRVHVDSDHDQQALPGPVQAEGATGHAPVNQGRQ